MFSRAQHSDNLSSASFKLFAMSRQQSTFVTHYKCMVCISSSVAHWHRSFIGTTNELLIFRSRSPIFRNALSVFRQQRDICMSVCRNTPKVYLIINIEYHIHSTGMSFWSSDRIGNVIELMLMLIKINGWLIGYFRGHRILGECQGNKGLDKIYRGI